MMPGAPSPDTVQYQFHFYPISYEEADEIIPTDRLSGFAI